MEPEGVDLVRLRLRAAFYADRAGASAAARDALADFLHSELLQQLVALPDAELADALVTDVYKPRMHKVYAKHLQAITVDFALNVRKLPFPLARMRGEDPELHRLPTSGGGHQRHPADAAEHARRAAALLQWLRGFAVGGAVWCRADHMDIEGRPIATASGKAESASNVETTLTQLLQHCSILAQVREIQRRRGLLIDRTERIANSLSKLAATVAQLNDHLRSGKEAVFAGRRSTDLLYLVLQNAFCARALQGYAGTSSVYAVEILDRVLGRQGVSEQRRRDMLGSLMGTHAHELMSMFAQLLAEHDDATGGGSDTPVQVSALVAHLVFIRTAGAFSSATALADTFDTAACIAAACAAKLPPEIAADLRQNCSGELPEGATVFDIFQVWRMDSGGYATEAEHVVSPGSGGAGSGKQRVCIRCRRRR